MFRYDQHYLAELSRAMGSVPISKLVKHRSHRTWINQKCSQSSGDKACWELEVVVGRKSMSLYAVA